MIHCQLINNARFSLENRETLSSALRVDEHLPHVLLQTCNRTELYWGDGYVPDEIVRHLYRVAAGLESALTGERAIQGQLKNAYQTASEKYHLPASIHKLFQTAIHTGRRVRSKTRIAQGAVSHSQVVIDILKQEQIDLSRSVVSIIGVNKITEDILKFLTDNRSVNVFLSNRNFDKAAALAEKYRGKALPLSEKNTLLNLTDVLISATSAPHYIVRNEDIRPDKAMLIIDLAFPRDVEPSLAERKPIKLFNLDDVERFARQNLTLRHSEIAHAEQIIETEINKFQTWYHHPSCTTSPY
jgi:glutamyl-tRNA reductase